MEQLKEVMSTHVEVIAPGAKARVANEKMLRLHIGALLVSDGEKMVGMVTQRDIAGNLNASVADTMTSPVVSVSSEMGVTEAACLMKVKRIRRLAVLDKRKKLVGFVVLSVLQGKVNEGIVLKDLERIAAAVISRAKRKRSWFYSWRARLKGLFRRKDMAHEVKRPSDDSNVVGFRAVVETRENMKDVVV